MLIKYSFGMDREAQLIEDAVRNVLDSGLRTGDLGGTAGTVETGDAIAKELEKLLKKSSRLETTCFLHKISEVKLVIDLI